ncbi:MAG TPA: HAD-IC family P-type ATPase [Acetobacteraceae bacterium]|nr:HAD-IC family P-type ATPase [Acetobacteraceae bacterium]
MSAAQSVARAPSVPTGLSSAEAARRASEFGPNAVAEDHVHPFMQIARHFWAPVPWMLEATILLQVVVGERLEAAMIATLLLLNVVLGAFQESRANAALELLKQRLSPRARVRRNDAWVEAPAADIVPGDIVELSLGGIVPADVRIAGGSLLLDQSMLTGESIPVEARPGSVAYAGALIRRGEAMAEVVATGARTYFGRTAELVRIAHVESSEQQAVLGVVRALTIVNFAIVVGMVAYAHTIGMDVPRIIPLVLTALLSAVPVALPATFTLAAALGARTLALKGVLLTRLSALHEAAMIDVLCADKTGTLTENTLAISAVRAFGEGYREADVLAVAASASSADGRDPIDTAIRSVAAQRGSAPLTVLRFTPFDPAAKMAEATVIDNDGNQIRVVKGAPVAVAAVAPITSAVAMELQAFTAAGYRALAVAAGPPANLSVVGLIAFSDPPRADSRSLLAELRSLGVRTMMVTGDAAATAVTVARAIGLDETTCPPGNVRDSVGADDFAVFAGVFPEDKFRLVRALQQRGHAVGMCGDGANDAPALRQAQMGIAVSTATDVAKAAAGIVLTDPGLGGIVTCIKEGRSAFQRVLTYTLSILVNKCATLVVMAAGLVMTGHAVLTPLLQALSMLAGDFVTMSRAADRAKPSQYPNTWRIRNLTLAAIPLGVFKLSYCLSVLAIGWFFLRLNPGQMQTLTFLMLVLAGQANVYVLRERDHFWRSHPAWVMLFASSADVAIVTSLAAGGVLMAPLMPAIIGMLFMTTIVFALILDAIKIIVRTRLRID